jgi:2',3'-cyclic-nucleotide 2'-phosphodiesterase (5'-nucleotidase family)
MEKLMSVVAAFVLFSGILPTNMVLASERSVEVLKYDLDTTSEIEDVILEEDLLVANITTPEANQTVLSILHVNDVHGRFDVGIHFARFATIANEYRAENPNTLVLDAGDAIHGTNFANMFRGESMIDLLNLVGVDAMVAGNHEFNFGQGHLLELEARADFPILGANVLNADGTNYLSPYTIIELEDVTVGIFGLATPTTPTVTHPNNVFGLTFTDPVHMAQSMVDYLEPQVDVVIALTHLGLSGVRGSQDVAAAVEGIDLIVEGHCHSVRPNGVLVNGTKIATVGAHASNLGTVEIILEDGEVVSVVAGMYTAEDIEGVAYDPAALALMTSYVDELNEVLSKEIGYSKSFLSNDYVRRAETALGNLTGDLFLEVTGADVAMMNSGGIRDHLHPGVITIGDISNIFPFGNVIEVYEVSGEVLLDALENSVSMFEINNPLHAHGRFPQIAGMSFTFDISQPAGSRISNLLVGGEPIDLTTTYTMATSGFVGAGGDGFTMIHEYGTFIGEFGAIDENLIAFIRERANVNAHIEGRMLMRDSNGYVRNPGVTEAYVTADNFVIHIDDVASMDVLSLSNAMFTLNGDLVDATLSYNIEIESIGVHRIPFTASYADELFEEIGYVTLFVVDDTTAWSDEYVIFSDNQLPIPFADRVNVTAEWIKNAGNVEAFRVADVMDVTELLVVNTIDLQSIQTATAMGTFHTRMTLNPEAVIEVILTDGDDSGDDHNNSGGSNDSNSNDNSLPQTGAVVISASLIGSAIVGLGLIIAQVKKSV